MPHRRITFSRFIIEEQRRKSTSDADLTALLNDIQTACKFIASSVSRGALAANDGVVRAVNVQDEEQKPLDVIANDIMLRECEWGGQVCGMASEELEDPYVIPPAYPRGRYLLVFDPLDGSSNLDVNVTVGSIFGVLRSPGGVTEPVAADFLQPGSRQVAAGFALYGATSMIILTLGDGVHGFTLDREIGAYTLTYPDMRIPEEFNMRWVASLVAEVYRILVRGRLFMDPRDAKEPAKPGRLRLLYEASPMAMIVEQAGGAASTGRDRILDTVPTSLHQRVPLLLGSRREVERLCSYHEAFDRGQDLVFETPLFNSRSLFRVSP